MPAEADVLTDWTALANHVFQHVFLTELNNVSMPIENFAFLADRITQTSDGISGLRVKIPFKTKSNNSWRAISRLGYYPTGSPATTDSQTFDLLSMAATAQVTIEDIEGTDGNHSLFGPLMNDALNDVIMHWPRVLRNAIWTPTSGVAAVVASISTLTVTVDNDGLQNTASGDMLKYLWEGVILHVRSSAGVSKGTVEVLEVDLDADTILIDADTTPTGIADGDLLILTDIANQEDNYNQSSPGVLDALNDDNTFQGTDRSTAGTKWARSIIDDNGGTARTLTRTLAERFFYKLGNPEVAITDYKQVSDYYERNFRENQRFMDRQNQYQEDYETVAIGKTIMISDADAHVDKLIVPDLRKLKVYDKGGFRNPGNEGWRMIGNRPFSEYNLQRWLRLGLAGDARQTGVLKDLTVPTV